MKVYIVVATKGRPLETYELLSQLEKQDHPIAQTIVVGSEPRDIGGLEKHDLVTSKQASLHISTAGSCVQRNVGLDIIRDIEKESANEDWVVVFFDDDFRPATDWVGSCANAFEKNQELVGMTGYVIADGVTKGSVSEKDAAQFISGLLAPAIALPKKISPLKSLYGCNMALKGNYAMEARFDEDLPLYGWLEDVDFSNRALSLGQLSYVTECRGVHLGVSKGRTSGVRFGYSQVANPKYLVGKGSMPLSAAANIMLRNILSNIFHTVIMDKTRDYQGRLLGNCKAFKDLLLAKCKPNNILKIKV